MRKRHEAMGRQDGAECGAVAAAAAAGRRGESLAGHSRRRHGARGTLSRTGIGCGRFAYGEGRARWDRAGRPTVQCCPTYAAELNVLCRRPRGGGSRTRRLIAGAARRIIRIRSFSFSWYCSYRRYLATVDDGRLDYYTDIGYTDKLPPTAAATIQRLLDRKN